MGTLRRHRRTRLASLLLCVTFIVAHPAIACTLMCLSQGHELAAHAESPMDGAAMGDHGQGQGEMPPCHSRQLTMPRLVVAMVLSPAVPSQVEVVLPEPPTTPRPAVAPPSVSSSYDPSVDRPPPRLV